MDIYVNAKINTANKIFKNIGFEVKRNRNYFSAVKYIKGGKYHILFKYIGGQTFCDFHFDNVFHFIAFGVDYHNKPQRLFNKYLKESFDKENIVCKIDKVNWFSRRNKAILMGFKL
jgi:hypothetical protein